MGDGALLFPFSVCVCVSPCQGYVVARTLGSRYLAAVSQWRKLFCKIDTCEEPGSVEIGW